MQLVDNGNVMQFSAGGGDTNFPFCKMVGGSGQQLRLRGVR
jgi:hypothetical protein